MLRVGWESPPSATGILHRIPSFSLFRVLRFVSAICLASRYILWLSDIHIAMFITLPNKSIEKTKSLLSFSDL